jgi:hypothetical protein
MIMAGQKGWLLLLAFLIAVFLPARVSAEPQSHTAVLLPFAPVSRFPGAIGSQWNALLTIFNGSDRELNLDGDIIGLRACRETLFCPLWLPPGVRIQLPVIPIRERSLVPPTHLLYVRTELLSSVLFDIRVTEASAPTPMKVQIPVVTEDAMFTSSFTLLDVPLSTERTRTLLRVYGVGEGAAAVLLRLFNNNETVVLEELLPLHVALPVVQMGRSFYPAYAEWPLPQESDNLRQQARIEIVPLMEGGIRYWAFASVTDNVTQHVVTINPARNLYTETGASVRVRH